MVNNKCCVPFCRTGYTSEKKSNLKKNLRNLALVTVPKDRELFMKWKNKIKLDRPMTKKDRVCEKHFTDNDIIKYNSFTFKDESVQNIPRKRFSLKCEAIPSIFPQYPSYWNSNSRKVRKEPTKRKAPTKFRDVTEKRSAGDTIVNDVDSNSGTISRSDDDGTSNTDIISDTVAASIDEQKTNWKSITEGEYTLHFQLDENFDMTRRVVVSQNWPTSSVRIYFGCVEIQNKFTVQNENDVSHILQSIDRMKICPGAQPRPQVDICRGIISRRAKRCLRCETFNRRKSCSCGNKRTINRIINRNNKLKKQVF